MKSNKRELTVDVIKALLELDQKYLIPVLDHLTMMLEREISGALANARMENLQSVLALPELLRSLGNAQTERRELWARFKILCSSLIDLNKIIEQKDNGIWTISEHLVGVAAYLERAAKDDSTNWDMGYYISCALAEFDNYSQEVTCPSEPMPEEEWEFLLKTIFHYGKK